jgi:hypothetical protein
VSQLIAAQNRRDGHRKLSVHDETAARQVPSVTKDGPLARFTMLLPAVTLAVPLNPSTFDQVVPPSVVLNNPKRALPAPFSAAA